MDKGWIKLMRGRQTDRLLADDPNAFIILTVIALRANRDSNVNGDGLAQGEAMIGDYRNYGLTRQEYRGALLRLRGNHQNNHRITIKATNKGTIAKLVDNSIYDININDINQRSNQQTTNKPTTNKNTKNKEVKKKTLRFFEPTAQEVSEYAKSISFELNSQQFVDYYQARGWKLKSGQPMRDWKAAVRTWKHRRKERNEQGRIHRRDTQYKVPAEYTEEAITV